MGNDVSIDLSHPTQEFVEFLLAKGALTPEALERAKRLQDETSERLPSVLVKLGLASERTIAEALAEFTKAPLLAAQDFPRAAVQSLRLSQKFLRQSGIAPIAADATGVTIAMADPLDTAAIDAVRYAASAPVSYRVGLPSDIAHHLDLLYGDGATKTERIVAGFESGTDENRAEDAERLKDLASEAPVIRLVNLWIDGAVEARASDIHIEQAETTLRVNYRSDGALRTIDELPGRLGPAVSSRIKIMARLDIAERRLPQDGKFRTPVRGREIDFRVSIVPTIHGENIVLRILDRGHVGLDFGVLGYDEAMLQRYFSVLRRPHGILLITGPTGSGKTTTLYTSLIEVRTPELKILTVEDPVEYQLDGINQTQVQPQIGLTFATALRSFLRHDPDIILVGEIRDAETARIAVQAALTGHLVLSTLHTNDAVSAINRLLDMGVDDYLIASTVNGVVAQRLVRRLCPHCSQAYPAPSELTKKLGIEQPLPNSAVLFKPAGCTRCDNKGFSGRTAIAEILVMSDAIRSLVMRHAPRDELQRAAVAAGMETIQLNGARKCLEGLTTVDEVMRATGDA
ncbi:MAG: Flp pilus assembly complex ATPase component TadA [Alphaproteobacteria bacterium]|nr:Flp pilus assembly complex ATPase component TadA [Alphaproteobacteria bacterium]